MLVVSCYIPPRYNGSRVKDCVDYITDTVLEIKRKYRDPYIIVAGNFNQWDIAGALADYHDFSEVNVGPTQGDRSTDCIFVTFGESVITHGSLPPLENLRRSDHRIAPCLPICHVSVCLKDLHICTITWTLKGSMNLGHG